MLLIWIYIFCFFSLFPREAFSFKIPEILKYDITWMGVKVGESSLEIKEDEDEIITTSVAQSAKWVSVFYTVNNIVESRLLKNKSLQDVGQPLNYKLNLREGRHKKNIEVIFEHDTSKAIYVNHLNNERKEFGVPPVIFDPLSGLYYIRRLNLEVGRSSYVTIFDSKKVWDVEIQVLRKESVKVPAGEFNTLVIKPLIKSEGIFYREGDIYIWVTDDERKIPVMIKTKVKIGSIMINFVRGNY